MRMEGNVITICLYLLCNKNFVYNCFTDVYLHVLLSRMNLGVGSEKAPFCVSMTCKAMLGTIKKLSSWKLPVVLHMDGTFKLTVNEFPVVIIGVTDAEQQLHVLSLSVVSHRNQQTYLRIVNGFKDVISKLLPDVTFAPNYIMTDAETAERVALKSVFPSAKPLMCYFHVVKACEEKLRNNSERSVIMKDITDLHMCLCEDEFKAKFGNAENRWKVNNDTFARYFKKQWVEGEFREWKVYESEPGVATTNNAVESFNSNLKKQYTKRKRMKIGEYCHSNYTFVIGFVNVYYVCSSKKVFNTCLLNVCYIRRSLQVTS